MTTAGNGSSEWCGIVPCRIRKSARSPRRRLSARMLVLAGLALGLAGPPCRAQCFYDVFIVPVPACPGGGPTPWGINDLTDDGQAAGSMGCFLASAPAIWAGEGTVIQSLPIPAGFHDAKAFGLTDVNNVVGLTQVKVGSNSVATYWRDGVPIVLGFPADGDISQAVAINDAGQIVGTWGNTVTGPFHGLIWQDGVMNDLRDEFGTAWANANDINELGWITGWAGESSASARAFVYDGKQITYSPPIFGNPRTIGVAINRDGDVAGWGVFDHPVGVQVRRAFLWSAGVMTDIGFLPETAVSTPTSINNVRQVVGKSGNRAFLWQNGELIQLRDYFPSEWSEILTRPAVINNEGQIGFGNGGLGIILKPIGLKAGDIDNNCRVDRLDLMLLLDEWGRTDSLADVNADAVVNVLDLLDLLADWG